MWTFLRTFSEDLFYGPFLKTFSEDLFCGPFLGLFLWPLSLMFICVFLNLGIMCWSRRACVYVFTPCVSFYSSYPDCQDSYPVACETWGKDGECDKNPMWMSENCKNTCNTCIGEKIYGAVKSTLLYR